MYSGLSGFTASQYLMKPSVIFLPSRMVSLESVIWTMRAITPSSRLRVIQSSCPSGPATNPSTVICTCSLSLRIVATSECPVWLSSAMRRLTFPEIDKRRDTSAYRFVRGACRCAARGVHGPIAGAVGPQRAQRRGDGSVVADQAFFAMHSISTAMPPGSAPAWIVVRAGNGAAKNVAYTSFIAAKSLMSRRYTLHLTTSSNDEPAAWRIARRFSNTRFVSDRTSPSSSFPESGLMHPWPATKMKSPSMIPCEYGPIGLGACSVTTAFLMGYSSILAKGDERGTLPPQ